MEDFYVIYVVEPDDTLIGIVPIKSLLAAKNTAKLRDLVIEKLHVVQVDTDQEEVARIMAKYNLPAVPVVDEEYRLLGRITFDDIMDVMETESTEDLLKIVGVSEDESLRGTWWDAVKSRLPWLLINVITASTAGFVVSLFGSTLEKIVVLASYMPVIAGVAGNGATQALAVTIRLLATEELPAKRYWNVVLKEVTVGLTNGGVIGTIVSVVAYFTQANPMLGLVVFMAMVGNLLIAGFAGSAVPLLLQRIKIDPAVASSILITAFTDILGYSLLLGFATWLLL
jgi:magnesium transporter